MRALRSPDSQTAVLFARGSFAALGSVSHTMLEVLETMVALVSLISTWRFCAVLVLTIVSYFVLMDAIPVGILRVMGLACSVVVGACWAASGSVAMSAWPERDPR